MLSLGIISLMLCDLGASLKTSFHSIVVETFLFTGNIFKQILSLLTKYVFICEQRSVKMWHLS